MAPPHTPQTHTATVPTGPGLFPCTGLITFTFEGQWHTEEKWFLHCQQPLPA